MVPYKDQYESRDNENEIINKKTKSYGEFLYENPNSTREKRQKKVKEFLDNYYPHSRGSHYFTYDSDKII
tara:strand:+ start:144 stop:353 length:210 start_codon:yes stop_codon:yes gene_type:complete